jgi:hypothetical protein
MRPNVPRVVTSGDVPARQPPKAPPKKKQPASSKHKQAPNPTQQKTHQAESVVLFANPANDGRPICLLCFARRLAAITDPAERAAWSIKEQDARAAWAVLGASGKPMKVSIPASDGWLFLLLTEQKWTRISKSDSAAGTAASVWPLRTVRSSRKSVAHRARGTMPSNARPPQKPRHCWR